MSDKDTSPREGEATRANQDGADAIPIQKWNVKRSGASMTIEGQDQRLGLDLVKITDVAIIEPGKPWPVATTKDGARYALVGPA